MHAESHDEHATQTVAHVEHLSRHYGEGAHRVTALSDVSIGLRRGEFTAIMGPSGNVRECAWYTVFSPLALLVSFVGGLVLGTCHGWVAAQLLVGSQVGLMPPTLPWLALAVD